MVRRCTLCQGQNCVALFLGVRQCVRRVIPELSSVTFELTLFSILKKRWGPIVTSGHFSKKGTGPIDTSWLGIKKM